MLVKKKFRRYEYPLNNGKGYNYSGSYTVLADKEPVNHEPGEVLVQEFEAWVKA